MVKSTVQDATAQDEFAATALTSLDGRYRSATRPLAERISEFALMRNRVRVEVEWFLFLAGIEAIAQLPPADAATASRLRALYESFDAGAFARIKEIERRTNHDMKAVEYFVKEQLDGTPLQQHREFVHFACTSEDINNIAYALMLRDAVREVWQPQVQAVQERLAGMAVQWRDVAMLTRTHGQAATPSTLGKEIAVFAYRLQRQLRAVAGLEYLAKINGATGTFSAHVLAYPDVDWEARSREFVESFGLVHNPLTTQIEPHDFMAEAFHVMQRVHTICTDLCVDAWLYISIGYFRQRLVAGEVGSSTMPHKVNPIDFENAEANFGLANASLQHLSTKLPVSRLQRDLSDSSTLRTIGTAIGYGSVALAALLRGLGKLELDAALIAKVLDSAWEVLGEGVQTVMRKAGGDDPYDQMKQLTRGTTLTRESYLAFIAGSDLDESEKQRLSAVTPSDYIGRASSLVDRAG
ncbi:adenylosuccinate lyase [Lichenicoccus roseus]|uniref:Adenylosuccinate lyase n=1 Tax=Lichenicoccus roseus TaxID=2683649 RepID=A0A5R9JIQ2_9PROT|nr:adenylosuccinate lyase [Lichenicoccus roseus]TLU74198.1 adenylosuccinate lyase [Lichenicoccus roseus]